MKNNSKATDLSREHEHIWSEIGPDAYCLGCLDERPEKAEAENERFRSEVRAKIQASRKLAPDAPISTDKDELEDKLQNDKSFQHILKFAPESQRELMTFEIARYFERLINSKIKEAILQEVDNLRREFWRTTWTPYDPDSIFKERLDTLRRGE